MAPQKCRGFLIRSFLPDGTPRTAPQKMHDLIQAIL